MNEAIIKLKQRIKSPKVLICAGLLGIMLIFLSTLSEKQEPQEVGKVLNTSDLLPTLLNLLGIESEYDYMGSDALDDRYDGFVPFSGGNWIHGDIAMDGKTAISISGALQTVTAEHQAEMAQRVQEFVRINNLILETDYYAEKPDT